MKAAAGAAARRDAALADALARTSVGDREAFARLYRQSRAQLFGVIQCINAERGQAEQVLQEVFVGVWRSAGEFDAARSRPMIWLTSLARNRAIDSLQRRKPRLADEADAGTGPLHGLVATDTPALQLLQQAARAQRSGRCVDELSPEQQQCLALAFYQGLSHQDIAAHLGQPPGTVRGWLRRALLTLT